MKILCYARDMKDDIWSSNTEGFYPVDVGQRVSSQSEGGSAGVFLQRRPTGVKNEPSLARAETRPLGQIRFNYYFH